MPLKAGKKDKGRGGGKVGRRKREAVKVDKDLPLQAEWRAVNPSQGGEAVFLRDGNDL